ncbi:hypothetical protein BH18ACT12_BH18ACT12_19510 [soil metagenome]
MMQETSPSRATTDDYVEFWAAGAKVTGEFHCSQCGYGVAIVRALPVCPMCGGASWEQAPWSPFSRSNSTL